MKILAIETSCDETGLALLEAEGGLRAPRVRVVKNIVASQIAIHAPFGGVVPGLAKREHIKNLPILYQNMFANSKSETPRSKRNQNSKFKSSKIDLLAVTVGPGLEPALWTGIEFAKQMYRQLKTQNPQLKLIGVNHLEGHLYSFLLTNKLLRQKSAKGGYSGGPATMRQSALGWPAIALIVSGGHTILIKMNSLSRWEKLGETRDDAVGEAFDKVARILGLPYPGGPEVERLAAKGNPNAIPFPRPMLHHKGYDFSFSGLKTAVRYHLRDHPLTPREDVAASFQAAAVEVLVEKTMRAAREHRARTVLLSGGVAANRALRTALSRAARRYGAAFSTAPLEYHTDNAAMIGVAGYLAFLRKKRLPLRANGILSV